MKHKRKPTFAPLFSQLFRGVIPCLLLFFLLTPVSLKAFDLGKISFYITTETLYRYNRIANEKHQFYQELSVFSQYKKWSVGVTLRGNNFLKQTYNKTLDEVQTDFYRKYIQYNSRYFKVNLGDFHTLLGRGLVLSVLDNEDIFRERTVLGGNMHYNRGRLDVKVLAGEVQDETYNQKWRTVGGEAGVEYIKNHFIGAHFSFIADGGTFRSLGDRVTASVSLKGSRLFKYFSYYAEAAILNFEDEALEQGHAYYGNLTFSKSHFTGYVEFRRYKDFDNELNNPPTADRADEVTPLRESTGGRLYLQYAFFEPDITLFFNLGRYREYDDKGNHIYGGITIEDLWECLSLSLSYGVRDIIYPIRKVDAHLVYQFSDRWSVDLGFKSKRYTEKSFKFRELDQTLEISCAPYFSVFGMYQYSYHKVLDLNHFWSGGVKVYLKGGTAMEFSGGTIRGGQVCAGGQCFVAPPFKGFKFSLLHTFK